MSNLQFHNTVDDTHSRSAVFIGNWT